MNTSGILDRIGNFSWQIIGETALSVMLNVVVVIVAAYLFYRVVIILLKRILVDRKRKAVLDERKGNTLFSLLQSVVFYVLAFTVFIHILKNLFHIDTAALLASAGILSIALGFGAQSFVKDIIGGFFIVFEDQYAVGEYVKIGEFLGTIDFVGVRATRIRAWGGELHIIPNGSISAVTNYSRGKIIAKVEMQMPYGTDLEKAMNVMRAVCKDVETEFGEVIVEAPVVQGVTQFGERNIVLRVITFTKPSEQWALEREMRRRIHTAFVREGLQMPSSQTVTVTEKPSL